MVLGKVLLGTTGVVFSGYVLVPPFRNKLERNILRPIRNYRRELAQPYEFKTEVMQHRMRLGGIPRLPARAREGHLPDVHHRIRPMIARYNI